MSMGTSISTGPGRPLSARRKALSRMAGSASGSSIRQARLTTGLRISYCEPSQEASPQHAESFHLDVIQFLISKMIGHNKSSPATSWTSNDVL